MAIRTICTNDDPVLRKKAREVTRFDARLAQLLEDMADTMYRAGGVGLAGPQVGVLRRVVVIDTSEDKSGLLELVNPQILSQEGEQIGQEGCLSLPGIAGVVRRPMRVTVRAQDRNGEFFETSGEGLLARAFCHEIAHLRGELFTDVMDYLVQDEDEEEDD
jgi:peptide deformylase